MVFVFQPFFGESVGNTDSDRLPLSFEDGGIFKPGDKIGFGKGKFDISESGFPKLVVSHTITLPRE
mgnify:CR=1 FL=1